MMDEPWKFESKRKRVDQVELLEKHQDGASLKFQVRPKETERNAS